jgi:hypothetical protein
MTVLPCWTSVPAAAPALPCYPAVGVIVTWVRTCTLELAKHGMLAHKAALLPLACMAATGLAAHGKRQWPGA